MSTVYKLAFASSALPSRMIGSLNKCMPNGLYEINNLSNEQYSICCRKAHFQSVLAVRPFCCTLKQVYVNI